MAKKKRTKGQKKENKRSKEREQNVKTMNHKTLHTNKRLSTQ